MDSKEVLETFGISKNFGIILFIQSIIVIIGCFLALQYAYQVIVLQTSLLLIPAIINLLFFIFLIYYSFIGFRKEEKFFKIAVYLYIINLFIILFASIIETMTNFNYSVTVIGNILRFILVCYFVYNLNNYDKAKIAILLVIIIEIICYLAINILLGAHIDLYLTKLIFVIPCVSLGLTYLARYNKKGFKQLSK